MKISKTYKFIILPDAIIFLLTLLLLLLVVLLIFFSVVHLTLFTDQVEHYIRAEYEIMVSCMRWMIERGLEVNHDSPFMQAQHDGVTVNHKKCQTFAFQLNVTERFLPDHIRDNAKPFMTNIVVAFAFILQTVHLSFRKVAPAIKSGSAQNVGKLFSECWIQNFGTSSNNAVEDGIADGAALSVLNYLFAEQYDEDSNGKFIRLLVVSILLLFFYFFYSGKRKKKKNKTNQFFFFFFFFFFFCFFFFFLFFIFFLLFFFYV